MLSPEDIAHQQNLLEINRRNLVHFLQQQAMHSSANVPVSVVNGILEARKNIARIKQILRDAKVHVDDKPDDEEPKPEQTAAPAQQSAQPPAPAPSAGPTYVFQGGTFTGPIGPAGDSSVSNVFNQQGWNVSGGTINNIAGDFNMSANPSKDDFLNALRQFKIELDKAKDLPESKVEELNEDVDSAIKAIDKPQPNKERAVERLTTIQKVLEGLAGAGGSALALGHLIGQVIQAAQGLSF